MRIDMTATNSAFTDVFAITRRQFFSRTARGLGVVGLASLLPRTLLGTGNQSAIGGLPGRQGHRSFGIDIPIHARSEHPGLGPAPGQPGGAVLHARGI